jgi:hypothetical protein
MGMGTGVMMRDLTAAVVPVSSPGLPSGDLLLGPFLALGGVLTATVLFALLCYLASWLASDRPPSDDDALSHPTRP